MIYDYLFEMSDSDLTHFDMTYDCHFEMTARILVKRIIFVNKIDFGHRIAVVEDSFSTSAFFLHFRQQKVSFLEVYIFPAMLYANTDSIFSFSDSRKQENFKKWPILSMFS